MQLQPKRTATWSTPDQSKLKNNKQTSRTLAFIFFIFLFLYLKTFSFFTYSFYLLINLFSVQFLLFTMPPIHPLIQISSLDSHLPHQINDPSFNDVSITKFQNPKTKKQIRIKRTWIYRASTTTTGSPHHHESNYKSSKSHLFKFYFFIIILLINIQQLNFFYFIFFVFWVYIYIYILFFNFQWMNNK